jgi:hypothetical protein
MGTDATIVGEGTDLTSGTHGPARAGTRECATVLSGRPHWSERERAGACGKARRGVDRWDPSVSRRGRTRERLDGPD